jgi:hypothetical protein
MEIWSTGVVELKSIQVNDRCLLYVMCFELCLPAIASRHVRHWLRLRQYRAGSGEAGGELED